MPGFESASSAVATARYLLRKYAYLLNDNSFERETVGKRTPHRGERLSLDVVTQIMRRVFVQKLPYDCIAAEFGIGKSTVCFVARRRHRFSKNLPRFKGEKQ